MDINSVYSNLIKAGIVRNQCDFSQNWLGRSRRYYSFLLATQQEPPIDVLSGLATRLDMLSRQFNQLQLRSRASQIQALASTLWGEVERRSIIKVPRRRHGTA